MSAGWVWGDGVFYTSTLEITLAECRKRRDDILADVREWGDIEDEDDRDNFIWALHRAKSGNDTGEDLLLIAYQTGQLYYTEWNEHD